MIQAKPELVIYLRMENEFIETAKYALNEGLFQQMEDSQQIPMNS